MPRFCLSIIFLILISSSINSQFVEEWLSRYDTPEKFEYSTSTRMARDSEGNLYVAGATNDLYAYLLIKYSSNGSQLWTRTYEGTRNTCIATGLAIDSDDNVVISGEWGGPNGDDIVVIKYLPNGDTIWTYKYDDSGYESAEWGRDMVMDDSGNVYIAGLDHIAVGENIYANLGVIIKVDSSGNLVWERFIEEDDDFEDSEIDLWQIEIDGNGDLYIGGSRYFEGNNFIVVAKYSPAGTQLWLDKYQGIISNAFSGMYTNSAGESFVT